MCSETANLIERETQRLRHELGGLWAAVDLIVLARTLALAHPDARVGLLGRVDESGDLIGEALVQVEHAAGELSDVIAVIR